MISVLEADSLLEKCSIEFSISLCDLENCIGKVLREDIYSDREQPPFDRVAMDGISISYNSILEGIKSFKIQETQRAGQSAVHLQDKNNCIEIMTGAVLPINTDCVIRVEDIDISGNIATIKENIKIEPMMNVHRKGSDHLKDEILIKSGVKISPVHIPILASVGKSKVLVSIPPRVAIISTGDELVDINSSKIEPYQIRMSNSYTIKSILNNLDYKSLEIFHLKDEKENLLENFSKILKDFDLIIVTGGVSAGKFDYIPEIMSQLEVKNIFHKISQRPGKPLWFGKNNNNKIVFALPGNPVSSMICLYRYVIPFLKRCSGLNKKDIIQGVLAEDFNNKKELTFFSPVKAEYIKGSLNLSQVSGNGSGDYYSLVNSDGFIELSKDDKFLPKGSLVNFFSWNV